jgi:drug/metabolite transporter (DMT)-like permease
MNVLYVLLSVFAAGLAGCGFVLQQHAAQQVQDAQFLRFGLIARLLRNRRWLAGIAIMVTGYLGQAWTLGHLELSVTEPLITTSLLFALILAVPLSGQALRKTEIAGALLLSAGVAGLSLTRTVKAPSASFGLSTHWPAEVFIALIAAFLVLLGRKRSGAARAALTGTAAGLMLGIADAFTRRSVLIIDGKYPLHLLDHPTGYAAVLASIIGLWLMQNAFNAAPLHASLPAVTAAEPFAGIVLGVLVFGDRVGTSPLLVVVQIIGFIAMVTGVIVVARAPVFSNLRLRELPHAALERLQLSTADHPPTGEPSAGHSATSMEPDNSGLQRNSEHLSSATGAGEQDAAGTGSAAADARPAQAVGSGPDISSETVLEP